MAKSQAQITRELREYIKVLTATFNVFAVVLFGSYITGKANDFSDIDVAIFSDDFGKNLFEDMKKLFKLRRNIDTDIEPLPFRKKDYFEHEEADFVNMIISQGKTIYKDGRMLI